MESAKERVRGCSCKIKVVVKIINLTDHSRMYTCNVYLVLGDWNAIDDVNTLVDVGRDPSIIGRINDASTGVGKKRVEQVVLTHSHFDHASLLPTIREMFNPTVYAFSPTLDGVDQLLKDGDELKMGDRTFAVMHTPGHSNDSVCLYCEQDGVVFSGDSPIVIRSAEGTYDKQFVEALEKLSSGHLDSIYFGHGNPELSGGKALVCSSVENIRGVEDRKQRK
jgi:glyoxylase-like metal-dependent hydrolase (beta-lactamase superfamily II)